MQESFPKPQQIFEFTILTSQHYAWDTNQVYKQNISSTPLVTYMGAPTFKLSKHLSEPISNIVGRSSYFVKISWHFQCFLIIHYIARGNLPLSLFPTSLFAEFPIDLFIEHKVKFGGEMEGLVAKWNWVSFSF